MVTINGTSFDLLNYYRIAGGISLTILGSSTYDIEEAIGDGADVAISDEYRGYHMKTASIYKEYSGTEVKHIVVLKDPSIEEAIEQNAADTEANAEAIIELAEIIAEITPESEEA